jgi:hypothetical protein
MLAPHDPPSHEEALACAKQWEAWLAASLTTQEGEPENVLAEPILNLAKRLGIRSGALVPIVGFEYGDCQMFRYGGCVLDAYLGEVAPGDLEASLERHCALHSELSAKKELDIPGGTGSEVLLHRDEAQIGLGRQGLSVASRVRGWVTFSGMPAKRAVLEGTGEDWHDHYR